MASATPQTPRSPPKALPPLPRQTDAYDESNPPLYSPRPESLGSGKMPGYTIVSSPKGHSRTDSVVSGDYSMLGPQHYGPSDYGSQPEPLTPPRSSAPGLMATPPPSGGKGGLSPTNNNRRRPLNESNANVNPHHRIPSINTPMVREEDTSVENHQPLQYHHQLIDDAQMKVLNKRASKLTVGTTGSDGSNGSEPLRVDHLLPASRNSYAGANIQRPDSRGRALDASPSLRPTDQRVVSRGPSRSPDNRMSYVDLLNVPYPQAPPSGAENLVNAGLRSAVGNNASLQSTMKTLEAYKVNAKKTSDPALQYEFAVFMISAAQEEGLDPQSARIDSPQSLASSRSDLLKEAKHILQKLCDRSYPFAQYYLADGYASGLFNNGKADLDRSFPLFLAASKHGHAEAMYRTALCYEWGWGCRVDAAKAVQFYQHAASKNHPGAMLRLGRACLTGDMGLGKRYREGVRWLKRGAESADFQYNQAPYDLACLHETGYGADVFKDESYAAQLFTKAADLGHKDASFRLGEAYEYGQLSCPKDPALSIHFYTGAAEQGHPQAQMALCAWYMVGVENVLEKDESEAYEWAKKAALNGLPKAQYTLGYFTEMGIGCRRDPLEANVWYVRAADQGEERAKHRIAAIRAAATGADPITAAKQSKAIGTTTAESEKKKRFGIF